MDDFAASLFTWQKKLFFLILLIVHFIICLADSESQLKEDEQLARALQESLNVESPPQHVSRNDLGSGNGYGNGHVSRNDIGSGNGYGNGNFYHPIPFPYSASFRYSKSLSMFLQHLNSRIHHCRTSSYYVPWGSIYSILALVYWSIFFR